MEACGEHIITCHFYRLKAAKEYEGFKAYEKKKITHTTLAGWRFDPSSPLSRMRSFQRQQRRFSLESEHNEGGMLRCSQCDNDTHRGSFFLGGVTGQPEWLCWIMTEKDKAGGELKRFSLPCSLTGKKCHGAFDRLWINCIFCNKG